MRFMAIFQRCAPFDSTLYTACTFKRPLFVWRAIACMQLEARALLLIDDRTLNHQRGRDSTASIYRRFFFFLECSKFQAALLQLQKKTAKYETHRVL